jgi:uridine kinase
MDTPVRPVVMGVAGGSGSGKSTVVREVRRVVGRKTVSVIHHDAYYRDLSHLTFEERAEVNFDHPDSLETELLVAHDMRRPQTRHLAPTPVVVIDGILALADERLRALMDLKVFVETDEQARLRRRIRRDMRDRGRSLASVRSQFDRTVRPMHDHFVVPSKEHADLVIAKGGFNREGVARVVSQLKSLLDSAEQT